MKVMQILNGFCHWDATSKFNCLKATEGKFASNIVFVETPDYVFEGWGYDDTAEGDDRFLKPQPPEGWLYDEKTGTFYLENEIPASKKPATEERMAALEAAMLAMMEVQGNV